MCGQVRESMDRIGALGRLREAVDARNPEMATLDPDGPHRGITCMCGRVRRPNRRQIGLICTQPSGDITNDAAEQIGGSSLAAYGRQMAERDLNAVWPATAIAESALPRNISGRKSTAPGSSRRVAVRAVRNPGPRPGRGRRGRARCSDGAPTPRSGGRGGTGEQSARQWGGRESQGPRGPRRARHR